jgi:DNA-binding NarL/FixJ family response regulator
MIAVTPNVAEQVSVATGAPTAAQQQAAPKSFVRVLIADDDPIVRQRMAALIEGTPSLELVGVATDSNEAVALALELEPDVVILDWVMPGGGGGQAATTIKERHGSVRIVGISAYDDMEASYAMLKSGAVAFLTKVSTKREIVETIESAVSW